MEASRETICSLADEVLRRLSLPRVGLLWEVDPPPGGVSLRLPVSVVHYVWDEASARSGIRPVYLLSALEDLRSEASTLDALAVVGVGPDLALDLLWGMPATRKGQLVAWMLDEGKPVVMEASRLRGLYGWRGRVKGVFLDALRTLERMGVVLVL